MRLAIVVLICLALTPWPAEAARRRTAAAARTQMFRANAYCLKGPTVTGTRTQRGTAAADPRVLPLGSRIRIDGARGANGVYTVADTGGRVKGRRLDIYMPSCRAARAFGVRRVRVTTLRRGWGSDARGAER